MSRWFNFFFLQTIPRSIEWSVWWSDCMFDIAHCMQFNLHLKCQRKRFELWSCAPRSTHKFLNPFPNKPWFLRVCSTSLLKTLWEKEKLLVTNNFSFSHSVFYTFGKLSAIFINFEIVVYKFFQFGRVWNLSFGKGLINKEAVSHRDRSWSVKSTIAV